MICTINRKKVADEFRLQIFDNKIRLIDAVWLVDIVNSYLSIRCPWQESIGKGDMFYEKPITNTLENQQRIAFLEKKHGGKKSSWSCVNVLTLPFFRCKG